MSYELILPLPTRIQSAADPVPSVSFCGVERFVGSPDEFLGIAAVLTGHAGDAETDRHPAFQLPAVHGKFEVLDRTPDPFRDFAGGVKPEFRHDHGKLFS